MAVYLLGDSKIYFGVSTMEINSQVNTNKSKSEEIIFKNINNYEEELFSEIKLSKGTKLTEVEFYNCKFVNCNFSEVIFFDCRFENCHFQNCNLSSISIKYSVFDNVHFHESKLTGIQWADAGIPLDVKYKKCALNYCSFIGVSLKKAELTKCNLREADFTETNLSRADCRYSDFTGARFINTNLEYTDLSHASNYSIHPDGNKLKKTIFSLPDVMSLLNVYDIIIK